MSQFTHTLPVGVRKIQLGLVLAAVLVAALLAPTGLRALAGVSPPVQTFSDVPPSHDFYEEIEWMAENDITNGFPDGTYRPNGNVTRQAMSAFMYRLAGEPPFSPPGSPTFSDVPPSNTFYLEIEWMADEGITNGFPGGLYKPNEAVKRQSMSAFMYRLAGSPAFPDPPTASFVDVPTSSQFYTEIEWMADEDITNGYPGNLFKPTQDVSRAAMAAFMKRLAEGPGVGI
jgi:hypothetical protein